MEDSIDFVTKLGPNAILVFVINGILTALRKSPLANWTFPFIAMIIGAVAYPFIGNTGEVPHEIDSPEVYMAFIGAGIGLVSVGAHQMVKQFTGSVGKSDTGGTQFIKKDEVK